MQRRRRPPPRRSRSKGGRRRKPLPPTRIATRQRGGIGGGFPGTVFPDPFSMIRLLPNVPKVPAPVSPVLLVITKTFEILRNDPVSQFRPVPFDMITQFSALISGPPRAAVALAKRPLP